MKTFIVHADEKGKVFESGDTSDFIRFTSVVKTKMYLMGREKLEPRIRLQVSNNKTVITAVIVKKEIKHHVQKTVTALEISSARFDLMTYKIMEAIAEL